MAQGWQVAVKEAKGINDAKEVSTKAKGEGMRGKQGGKEDTGMMKSNC